MAKALKNMNHSKSLVLDGFSVEFFKVFFFGGGADTWKIILQSVNYCYKNGIVNLSCHFNNRCVDCLSWDGTYPHKF